MKLVVSKHKPYSLKIPEFMCDKIIKDAPVPFNLFLTGYRFIVLCGRPGSGKTSLLISCLLDSKIFKKTYNHVYLFMPTSSRNSLKNNPFKKHDPSKMYDSLDDLHSVYASLEQNTAEGESSLIIVDDLQAQLKRPDINILVNRICANRRHLKCTVIICLQNYNLLPLSTRKLLRSGRA